MFFSGLLLTVYNIGFGYPRAELVFSFVALPVTILVPVIACTSFTAERKSGTDRFLLMLPISSLDTLLGKYFARLSVLAIPTALMSIYPVILDVFGDVGYLSSFASLLAFALYEAVLLAFGMMISALAKNSLHAFLFTYGALAISFFLPYIPTWLAGTAPDALVNALNEIFLFTSPYGQFDYFSTGIFDLRKIVWFLIFTALCLFVAWQKQKRSTRSA